MHPIKQLRLQAGLTQQALAARTGTSQSTIAAYEAGRKSPTLRTVQRMAAAVGQCAFVSFWPSMTPEDQRSLAFHEAIVRHHLLVSPETVIAHARSNVTRLRAIHPHAHEIFLRWQAWLDLPMATLIGHMLAADPIARDMRQSSPFSGILNATQRRDVLRELRCALKNTQS